MLSSFRRLSKSTLGSVILVLFLLAIVASFAIGDIAGIRSGNFGLGSSTLVKIGKQEVTDRDISRAMERRLADVRQQNPEADYAALAVDYEPLLAQLVDQRTLGAFGDKYGFVLSKRLVDAEIANLPGTRGLDGKFSDAAYQGFLAQQRMTDQEVRRLIAGGLIQRLLLTPLATNPRLPVGVATPYAAMLLEARLGDVLNVPIAAFRTGLNPTDTDLQRYYAANRTRYMVPEQRVLRLARMGPEQVANVAASDAEISAYYNANQAIYGAKDIRTINQALVPDQAVANAIAARARGGADFVAAVKPAGLGAKDVAIGPQSRADFASVAGDKVAAAAFAASAGAIVGPIQSDLGWHVIKIVSVKREGGKPLAAARAEIAAKLTADKRKEALTDLVTRVEDVIADGSNFAEAAAGAKLPVTETPLITAAGASRTDPAFRLPAELAPALRSGFELQPNDEPVVETLPNEGGYVLVAPSQVVPAAPAALATIRARVAEDWINSQAAERAKAVASAVAAKSARGVPLAQAAKEAGTPLPAIRQVGARRLDMAQMGDQVPPAIRMLFNLSQGKSRMVADAQGRGYSIVKVNRIVPGNALSQPALIGRLQTEFQEQVSQEYAHQFLAAARGDVGVRRNASAIAASKKRITGGS